MSSSDSLSNLETSVSDEGVIKTTEKNKHELVEFKPCTFGDGGFYYHDGADRAICSCGWKSAAIQRDNLALIALWKIHRESI
jgi:hypothetical protein